MNIRNRQIASRSAARHSQRGTAAIEMAIVFPLLFAVTYATVVYGYVFYVQQTLNRIAEEAVRTAVKVDPSMSGYSGALDAAATASFNSNIAMTPIIAKEAIVPTMNVSATSTGMIYTFSVAFPISALASSGFATITLPVGTSTITFPPLPTTLMATAVASVN